MKSAASSTLPVRSAFRTVLFLVPVLVAAASLARCTLALPGPDHEFHNYQTAVAQAPKEDWTPYWLGRSFDAGGLHFTGPTVADFGDEISGGGVTMDYDASHGVGNLAVSLFSSSAWQDALRRGFGRRVAGSEQNTFVIAGVPATVTSGPVHNEGVRVDMDFGNTHVLVRAGPSFDLSNHDTNTLNDVTTLVDVLQNLRPYPQ